MMMISLHCFKNERFSCLRSISINFPRNIVQQVSFKYIRTDLSYKGCTCSIIIKNRKTKLNDKMYLLISKSSFFSKHNNFNQYRMLWTMISILQLFVHHFSIQQKLNIRFTLKKKYIWRNKNVFTCANKLLN